MEQRPKRLLDQVRKAIRLKHYSIRTEQGYVTWIKQYILFHDKRHPREMRATDRNRKRAAKQSYSPIPS